VTVEKKIRKNFNDKDIANEADENFDTDSINLRQTQ
jgi:hypothetical protein